MAALVAAHAVAAEKPQHDADMAERCKQKSKLADVILSIKQHGGTLAEMMSATGNDETMRPLMTKVYEEQRHYSEQAQQRVIADLKDRIYSECMAAGM